MMVVKINNYYSNKNSKFYGGEIYRRDYDAHHTMADIAARIAADQRFEKRCLQNAELRKLRNSFPSN